MIVTVVVCRRSRRSSSSLSSRPAPRMSSRSDHPSFSTTATSSGCTCPTRFSSICLSSMEPSSPASPSTSSSSRPSCWAWRSSDCVGGLAGPLAGPEQDPPPSWRVQRSSSPLPALPYVDAAVNYPGVLHHVRRRLSARRFGGRGLPAFANRRQLDALAGLFRHALQDARGLRAGTRLGAGQVPMGVADTDEQHPDEHRRGNGDRGDTIPPPCAAGAVAGLGRADLHHGAERERSVRPTIRGPG